MLVITTIIIISLNTMLSKASKAIRRCWRCRITHVIDNRTSMGVIIIIQVTIA